MLPPDVLSILTDNDDDEMTEEEKTHSSYNKLVEAVSETICSEASFDFKISSVYTTENCFYNLELTANLSLGSLFTS